MREKKILGIVLIGFLVFLLFKSSQKKNFSLFEIKKIAKKRFKSASLAPPTFSLRASEELIFIQGAQITAAAPPVTIRPQTLGALGSKEERDEIIEYTVKKGDTPSGIASFFGIDLNTLLWANDLTSNSVIKPGEKLIVLPVSGLLYSVKKGDTLSEITRIYKGSVDEIVAFNELSSQDDIFPGDLLIIPGGEMPKILPQIPYIPLAESYFIFPAQGRVSQGPHGFRKNAIDITNKCGTPVVAIAGGRVLRAGPIWIGGNRMTILHSNGVVSYYGHLSTILIRPGQDVNQGDVIGYIGNTGYTLGATGCHLHFALRGARNFLSHYPVGSYLKWK